MTYFERLTSSRPQRLTGPWSTERLTTGTSCVNRTGEQHDLNTDAKQREMVADQGGTVQDITDQIRCSTTAPHVKLGIILCSPFLRPCCLPFTKRRKVRACVFGSVYSWPSADLEIRSGRGTMLRRLCCVCQFDFTGQAKPTCYLIKMALL
ncbi:hypothetical protein M431DRAFT_206588 [Trichoderma harzianum CBS 226.95]|uniref:Uncharacterized protein n=1 Tax=Trichoderma harzianum CBS 226.95 TaxID=983964 RepID=A0A2T4AW74_TRIHA|nr:hypothetical protein M431DRAFT_206588 [Trichoderma harzianum CBS 226.95]PTB61228.1 hypothetical protein M431DRAFT_206588 [Trichoderma harzianum CBS 226.95]